MELARAPGHVRHAGPERAGTGRADTVRGERAGKPGRSPRTGALRFPAELLGPVDARR
ncbi:hypothetical protein [Streptomyces sp. BK022]|uniref:hypothetical protein n=1 Tax=Streptomyces sp. BK022 TaxID=2512123 RepID=UPI0013EF0FB0|nr:hypothetical protein [Streptomyces sp. BK022]